MDNRLLYRPEEVAKLTALGRTKVFELIASGELASISVGRARRIPRAALERWIDGCAKVVPTKSSTPPAAPEGHGGGL